MKKLLIVIAVLVVLVPGGLVLVGLALGHTKVRMHTLAGPVREIVVKSGSGDVDLVAAGARVQVRDALRLHSASTHLRLIKPRHSAAISSPASGAGAA